MIRKLFTATLNQDAAVSYVMPDDCVIVGLRWVLSGVSAIDGSYMRAELSFNAINQLSTNDTVNVIDQTEMALELTTSGGAMVNQNEYHPIPRTRLDAGEKLYLHTSGASVTTPRYTLFLYCEGGHADRTNKGGVRRGR